jgi:protein TonB
MTERLAQFRNNLLWPFSIVAGLFLHLVLISFLWHICTSCDDMQPPVLRLISLSKTVLPPPPEEVVPIVEPAEPLVEPEPQAVQAVVEPVPVPEPEPVIEPVIEPEPVVEQKAVEPEPVIAPKPVAEPAKPKTIKPKPRVNKPIPAVKPVAKAPADPQPQPVAQPVVAAPATVRQPVVGKPAVTAAPAAPVAVPAPAKDFSSYLQKIYRQLERGKKYPDRARRRGIAGKVTVAFSISGDGRAVGATIVGKAPGDLADAALKLVESQKFASPPEGWNSASRIEMQINYTLR